MSSRRARFATSVMRTTILSGFLASQIVPFAIAGPSGGVVVGGQGLITQAGVLTQINQSSDRLIIEWDSFDTTTQETVRFFQPSRNAMALNRVLSGQATQFNGSLFANGNVVIVNGAGIHFGPTSYVDVGGLIASTADITNSNFLSNRLIFDQAGDPDAMVTNAGTITARDAGLAALVAPGVENSGLIRAQLGTVILASGETHTIDFRGDGLISFALTSPTTTTPRREDDSEADALVTNSGTVEADGGSVVITASQASRVLDTAINLSGVAQANSVGVRNGRIVLGGGGAGRVRVSGQVSTRGTSAGTTGGTVHVTGEEIAVQDAQIDASGADGGGTVLVGGAERGGTLEPTGDVGYLNEDDLLTILVGDNAAAVGNGFMPTSVNTTVGADAVIAANAIDNGDGGTVIVWADDTTYFAGAISAMGGTNGGDGGFVETSGVVRLGVAATASVNALAPHGAVGDWLLDPRTILIQAGGGATLIQAANGADITSALTVDPSAINGATANVSLIASETITFADAVNMTNAGVGLTATAGDSIMVNASVTTNNGAISFISDDYDINAAVDSGTGTLLFDRVTAGLMEVGLNPGTSSGGAELDTNELALLTAGDLIFGDPTAAQNQVSLLSLRQFPSNPNISGLVQFNALDSAGSFLVAFGTQTYPSVEFNSNDGLTFTANATIATTVGDATFNVDADGTGVVGSFDNMEVNDGVIAVVNSAADILVTAPDIFERGTGTISLNANNGAGTITVQRSSIGTIGVGGGNGRLLQFSDAQLARLTAGTINFGNPTTPNNTTAINVNAVDLSAVAGVSFNTAGEITFIGANSFVSIATNGGPIAVNGTINASETIDLTANSPITFAANLSAGGNITATAGDTGLADADTITVNPGVTVQSTGGNVSLLAGDDVVLGAGATVSANGTLTLTAGHNDTDGDGELIIDPTATLEGDPINLTSFEDFALGAFNLPGITLNITSTAGAIIDGNDPVDGTLNITALNLSMTAATGIGGTGATATIETQVSNLEAQTGTGGIFLENTGDLTIGGVTGALSGMRVVTAGDIELTNAGRIDINVAGERVVGPAAVTVIANGATADILTGSDTVSPNATVQSSGGTVTLRAGQDLLLGDTAGAGTLGNVFGGGSVVLDAGRDIIVDTGTFIQASGDGTIMANAGRNISIIDTSGPFSGAEIRTEGGDITLTTGLGGVFTANNDASPAVQTTVSGGNGNITIIADAVDIQNSILAGTGIVTLQTVANGQLIDLGGTDAFGTLGLTDAELDFITAGTLLIGSTTSGSIEFTAAVSPANVTTLSLITGDAITDNNTVDADIIVANLAMQAVNGIGSADAIDLGVNTVAAANSTSGSIRLLQLTGLGDLTVGTVDGVVGISNQATTGPSQTRIQTQASNLIINSAVTSALDPLALLVGGNNSLLDNNASISTTAGFGIDLQGASMALEDGTVTAGNSGRVRINPFFVGQAIDLGSTSDAGAALALSDTELDTITAGTLRIGQSGIGDITITDAITLTNTSTLNLETSGAVLDSNLGTDITVDNLVFRTGSGFGTTANRVGLDVNDLAFANTGGVVNLSNLGDLTIAAVDGLASSSNSGTTTAVELLGNGTLTFAVDTSSTGDATFTASTATFNNSVDIDVTAGTLAVDATTINLDGNLDAPTITGTATTVNVIGSIGGAEIQDAVDVAASGATVNVGDGTFAGGITIDRALTMLGDGFTSTTTVNVADGTAGMAVTSNGVTIDGFQFTGDGTPVNATGILIDGSAGALSNILIGDANTDALGSRFTGLTTGMRVIDGGSGNPIGIEVGLGNVFDSSTDGIVLDGPRIALTGNTFNNTSFASISGDYIRLENGAAFLPDSPTVLDATSATFDGALGSALTIAQAIAVEDGLIHYLDDPTLGLINIGQLVVAGGNSIQTAVNAAGLLGGAQTVNVGAGTFGGSVEVWVDDLTLIGQGATTIIDTGNVDSFANNGDIDTGFVIGAVDAGAGDPSGTSNVRDVTIQGFTFAEVSADGDTTGIELGIRGAGGSSIADGANIIDNFFQPSATGEALLDAIELVNVGLSRTWNISGNVISVDAVSRHGIFMSDGNLGSGFLSITDNTINAAVDGIHFAGNLTDGGAGVDVLIEGNVVVSGDDALEFAGLINSGNDDARNTGTGPQVLISGNSLVGGGAADNYGVVTSGLAGSDVLFAITDNQTNVLSGIESWGGILIGGANADYTNAGNQVAAIGDGVVDGARLVISGNDVTGTGGSGVHVAGTVERGLFDQAVGGPRIGDRPLVLIGMDDEAAFDDGFRSLNTLGLLDFEGSNLTSVTLSGNTITGIDDAVRFADIIVGADIFISDEAIAGAQQIVGEGDGIEFSGLIGPGSSVTISGNQRIEGQDDDAIEFNGAIRQAEVTIADNTAVLGDDNGIEFEDVIRNSVVAITDNPLIQGGNNGIRFEELIRNSDITIDGNESVQGLNVDGIAFAGPVRTNSDVQITDNTIEGADNGIIFQSGVTDSAVTISDNDEIRGLGVDGISFFRAARSTIDITDNIGIFGDGFDGIFVERNLIDTDLTINRNRTIAGLENGISLSAGLAVPNLIAGGSVSISENGSITGTDANGIIVGGLLDVSDMTIASNDEIRGGADGIAIFGAALSAITITDNTGIYGDGFDGIFIAAGLLGSDFAVSGNDEIVGADDGMNLGAILGGSFSVEENTLIRGMNGSGMEFEGPVFGISDFAVENNELIIGDEEAIEFDTPAVIIASDLRFTGNTMEAGTDGMLFDGLIAGSSILTEENSITAGENGIRLTNLGGGSSFITDRSEVTGGLAGLMVRGSAFGGGQSNLILGETNFNGSLDAGISVTTRAGGSAITTAFQDGVVTTGLPSLAMSGPNQAIAGNTIGNVIFNSIGGGNFITLSNGALFEPGRPTVIMGTGATFDGTTIGPNAERQTIDWVESRIIDFDDNATLGQIFFLNVPYLFDSGFGDGPVRTTNIQTPGDWILRPDFAFQILATNPLRDDYGLGTCLFEYSEVSRRLVPRCITPAGADPSPSILQFMEGMEQLSALQ